MLSRTLDGDHRGRLAAVAAACSGGGGSAGGPAGDAATGPNPVNTEAASVGKPVTDYLDYVGGKAGRADPDRSPIAIGWVNFEGGALEMPEATQGAESAVRYVNAELGGIDGHPLELHTCFIKQAEEEGQKCGQQLLNDREVSVIAYGNVSIGAQSVETVVNGEKPIVIGVSASPSDATAKNTYILEGDQTHVFGPWGTFARDVLHAKTAAVIYPSTTGSTSAAAATKKGLERAGVTVKSVGYDPNASDLLGPLTAAGGQTADVIVPMTDAIGCVNLYKAMRQIGSTKPTVSAPLCLSPQVSQGLGDLPVGWTFGIAQTLPTDTKAPDAAAYLSTATKHGLPKENAQVVFAALGWASVLTVAKLMNEVGAEEISPDTMTERLKAFKGPLVMGPPSVQCGKYPDAPAVCNDQTRFYKYLGKGRFQALTGWLRPPE
ncbi:MAG: ABC transporter substrate-binding protein [Streptosporangiales bacterium]|nr:ABC transporter substrate-binding protein [Streptosporangiales bacterium]